MICVTLDEKEIRVYNKIEIFGLFGYNRKRMIIMKVIILTMSTGNGHNIASYALKNYLKSLGMEAKVVDAYKFFNKQLSDLLEKGYLMSTKYAPYMYGKFYRSMEKHNPESRLAWSTFCNSFVARQFAKYISRQNPDMVVSTHSLAAVLMSEYKRKKLVDTKTIGIVTDFCILPYWDMADMDYYITANEHIKDLLIKKGIHPDKILPYGIPIDLKFSQKISKEEARRKLGIENKETLFIISGSMGFGKTEKYIKSLDSIDRDFQIISVCGRNENMKNRVDRLITKKKVYNFGYVDNVDVIMDASDIIVTKPGGLTVSEAIAKKLPMVLVDPIPGQEDRNKEFLINNSLAMGVSKNAPLDEVVSQLIKCPERREQIKTMQTILGKPLAAKTLGDRIVEILKEA